jgi:hypothetical protein
MAHPVAAAFLIAHGLVHLAIYGIPADPDKPAPFDPGRSWVLDGGAATWARGASVAIACVVAAGFSAAGWMLAIDAPGAAAVAGVAAGLGIVLKGVWFHPWLTVGLALDAGIVAAALLGWPA